MDNKYKILIYGSGAVGGYFGGRLAQNPDNDVTFIARSNYGKLKSNGLNVKSVDGDFKINVKVYKSPAQLKTAPDLIILAMKAYDTDEVIKNLKDVVSKDTLILSIQNGLTNYDKLVKAFGKTRAVRGFCYIGSEMLSDGRIVHSSNGFIVIGKSPGIKTEIIKDLERKFTTSGVKVRIAKDIEHDVWAKFSWNCVHNILCTIIGKDTDSLFSNKYSEKLTIDLYGEIRDLAKAHGVKLTKKDEKAVIDRAKTHGPFKPSTLQDRERGKMLEYETFTGDVVRLAAKKKVNVPINKVLYSLLKAIDN